MPPAPAFTTAFLAIFLFSSPLSFHKVFSVNKEKMQSSKFSDNASHVPIVQPARLMS